MGRRSNQLSEDLKPIILRSAVALIEDQGLEKFSMRKLASEIGYTVGTIYNFYADQDELFLYIKAQLLDEVFGKLGGNLEHEAMLQSLSGQTIIFQMSLAFFEFAQAHKELWRLIAYIPTENVSAFPEWYQKKYLRILEFVDRILQEKLDLTPQVSWELVIILWAGLQGLSMLFLNNKLGLVSKDSMDQLIRRFVESLLAGVVQTPG